MWEMDGSIVPWNGFIEDRSFSKYHGVLSNELMVLSNGVYPLPSSCIIDTRNDTWFNLDMVVTDEKLDKETVSSNHISVKKNINPYFQNIHTGKEKEEQKQPLHPAFPILPSYFDTEDEDLNGQSSEKDSSSLNNQAEEKKTNDSVLESLRYKLNAIIENHNYLTEEIKEITNKSIDRLEKV